MMAGEMEQKRFVIPPARFTIWLFIIATILFFGALTSAYIVSRGIEISKGTWLVINIPSLFAYTTGVLVISSVTLQWSLWMARKDDFKRALAGLSATFVLGLFFLAGQMLGWRDMAESGVIFASSNAGNFMYVFTGFHSLHLVAGLIYLVVVLVRTLRGKYTAGNLVGYENCVTFWHFLGLLWIYLFIFLLINHA